MVVYKIVAVNDNFMFQVDGDVIKEALSGMA